MRIQNNITAMNTHRQYTINNDNVAKSAEKLSSGYRINRAGDDAAGLAISEKMRSQIRGLNMATKNSQDAISLVQTAEGALQETHSMLQRMNELAVQAATGTNENLDRTALAKEFEQLKREINDVAEQTNFNNMKILDGSLSYEGYVRSASTAGVNNTITGSNGTSAVNQTDFRGGLDAVTGAAGKLTFNLTGIGDVKANDSVALQIKIGDKVYTTNSVDLAAADVADENALAKKLAGLKVNADGSTFTVAAGTGSGSEATGITLTAGAKPTGEGLDLSQAQITLVKQSTPTGSPVDATDTGATFGGQVVTTEHKPDVAATKSMAEYSVDASKASYGDTFTINGKTYEIADKDAKVDTSTPPQLDNGNIAVVWNGKTGADSDLVDKLAAAINTDADLTAAVTGDGSFRVETAAAGTAPADAAGNDKKVQLTSGNTTTKGRVNTIEFDIAKMKDGDKFTIESGGKKIQVEFSSDDDRASFMKKVSNAAADAGIGEVKGNALIIKDAAVSKISLDSGKLQETNAIRIQVGANEHEMLSISIDSMNTAGLGLDDAALTKIGNSTSEDQDLAGKAITAVKTAIDKVSDQRATLGAMQNRLDHKIANLKVSSENLSAAESRIRDVDMAEEMTNFTKNNILSQAATAMLAQANALPQNVLSLLG